MNPSPLHDAPSEPARGLAGRIAAMFVESKLTPIAVIASILLGAYWMAG